MTDQQDTLSLLIRGALLLKNIEDAEGHERRAQVSISDQSVLELFRELDDKGAAESKFTNDTGQLVAFDDMSIEQVANQPVPVLFHPRHNATSPFAWSLNDLLERSAHRIEPPADFYIADLNYRKGDPVTPSEVCNYYQVACLAKLLRDVADHAPGKDQAIFLGANKLEMSIGYEAKNLQPLEGLDFLDAEIRASDHHHSQRLEVFRNTLIESLAFVSEKTRTQYLIAHFKEFVDRYHRDFQLYAKDFTATRQIEDISKKQLELAEKIDDILASIQNRLLALPITLVLAAGQFSADSTATTKNILIFIGWLIFSAFVGMMISNQRSTLTGIGNEIGRLKNSSKELDVFDDVADKFSSLGNSHGKQGKILCIVGGITIATTLLIIWLFIQSTYPELISSLEGWLHSSSDISM